ncbi:MAG: LysM peptidoglycan-binding domain-containing protein [Ectothiorhodospiraceae bacterium]|nr:LysM peptidoglycan-binding domain-containing protein [Ectothiorhodospiraceae bacterium]
MINSQIQSVVANRLTQRTLILLWLFLGLTACIGVENSPLDTDASRTANAPQITGADASDSATTSTSSPQASHHSINDLLPRPISSTHARPRHIPFIPDAATPWWAVVARWDSDEDKQQPWSTETPANAHAETADAEQSGIALTSNKDLWTRLRSGFQLGQQDHRLVQPYIVWYAKHQAYLDRVVERARPFLYDIVQEIEARGMPMEIALLPVVESAFQPFAYSPGRAAGIWQFIPSTGKHYGLKQNWWYDGRRDVSKATTAALDYLQRLHKRFDGDWLLALASYNSGEGRVARAVKKNKKKGKPTDFWSLDLPKETEGYVPKLLAISAIILHTEAHGLTLTSIPDEPYLERIDIGSQIDLALAAELADLPIETMYQLNPAFNRWATDPKGPHVLSLPIDKATGFRKALANVDKKNRVRWERHRIREGETLGHIARKFQTTVALLQEVNSIRDKWIRAGQSIIIPVATKSLKHYLSEDRRRATLQGTKRSGHKLTHTVKRGDTFWDLSRKYKVKVSQLASWNGMSPKDALKLGQRLVVWTKSRNLASRKFVTLPRSVTQQQLHYRVRKGDSLARIAQKFSVTVRKLRSWNSLKKGKYLQPGQRLTLYVDVTEQS